MDQKVRHPSPTSSRQLLATDKPRPSAAASFPESNCHRTDDRCVRCGPREMQREGQPVKWSQSTHIGIQDAVAVGIVEAEHD